MEIFLNLFYFAKNENIYSHTYCFYILLLLGKGQRPIKFTPEKGANQDPGQIKGRHVQRYDV